MPTYFEKAGKINARIRVSGMPEKNRVFSTLAEAELWAEPEEERLREEVAKRDADKKKAWTLKQLLQHYWTAEGATQKGHKQLNYQIKRLQGTDLAQLQISKITSKDIRDYRDLRIQTTKAATVSRDLAVISSAYTYGISELDWGIKTNPVSAVRRKPSGKGRERRLDSDEEIELVLKATQSDHLRDFVELAIETAMRRSEILSLSGLSFDKRNRVVRLDDTKNGNSRHVPLSKKAFGIVQRRADGIKLRSDRLFDMTPDAVSRAFARACKRAGVKDLRLHDLRHEAASRLFENKRLDIMEVASITGHEDLRMLKRYTHMNAVKLVDRLG